ncbi:MAG: sensor histidine kinase [Eubacteriales bacterium]
MNNKKIKNSLVKRSLVQLASYEFLFSVGWILFIAFVYYFIRPIIWSRVFSPVYPLIKIISVHINEIFILIWVMGFIIILFNFWHRSIDNLNMIVNSIDQLFETDSDLIHLPGELKEVEEQLNQIKYDIMRNEQLAKEAEQRKNDLVVYLAHDLKTPLTSVIGYLSLLHDEVEMSNNLREKYLSIALSKSERLEELINEFFEITRFNLKDLTLVPGTINLSRMLQQITSEFEPLLAPKDLSCKINTQENIIIRGDAKKLDRVFDNLIRNAISYSYENSEILISIDQTTPDQEQSKGVAITFKNRGDTIPQHKLEHIFEEFYRLDAARTTSKGGAGLGLAIAKVIIELHKGTISASSHNDIIIFKIFIPSLL